MLDPRFADKLVRALAIYEGRFKARAVITSGHRSTQLQQDLYDRYRQGRGPIAAPPGRSCHEFGAAADLVIVQKGQFPSLSAAKQGLIDQLAAQGLKTALYVDSQHVHAEDTALCQQLRGLPATPQLPSSRPAGSRRGTLSDPPLTPTGTKGCP